jgi:hypothetical protein
MKNEDLTASEVRLRMERKLSVSSMERLKAAMTAAFVEESTDDLKTDSITYFTLSTLEVSQPARPIERLLSTGTE